MITPPKDTCPECESEDLRWDESEKMECCYQCGALIPNEYSKHDIEEGYEDE